MTREEFWQFIDSIHEEMREYQEDFNSALELSIDSLEPEEIIDFARHYAELQNEANTPAILEAAFIIGCGPSNDGFMDFRRWIVFQGKTVFSEIVANPDFLGTYDPEATPIEHWYCEYHPMWAYKEATGKELPHFFVDVYPDAPSDFNNERILAERYPNLWRRCKQ